MDKSGWKILLVALAVVLLAGAGVWARSPAEEVEEEEEVPTPALPATEPMYNEAPMLAAKVKAGELPPVEERLPEEPVVIEAEDIGQYGGSLTVYVLDGGPWGGEFTEAPEIGPRFYYTNPDDGTYRPELMENIEVADDRKSATLYLKKGVKWSDGEPVKVEDYLFAFNDMTPNTNINNWGTQNIGATKIDDLSFRVEFENPWNYAPAGLANSNPWGDIFPSHYLKKWHIDYNPDAEKVAKEEGFDEWWEAFHNHFFFSPLTDIEKPILNAWYFTKQDSNVRVMERNPYYLRVDNAGNQLPYIDQIIAYIVNPEMKHLKIITGEADIAYTGTSFLNYTLYKENAEANDMTVYELEGPLAAKVTLHLMQTCPSPEKNEFFRMDKFRQAMSLAIDRDEINKVVYLGKGVPGQATMHPNTSYFKQEWWEAYADYDPERANRMLDEVGLEKKNQDGIRLMPDGSPFQIVIEYSANEPDDVVSVLELVTEFWENVGIDVLLKASQHARFWELGPRLEVIVEPVEQLANFRVHKWSKAWAQWLGNKAQLDAGTMTMDDFADGTIPGEEPPDWVKDYYKLEQVWFANMPPTSKEYFEAATKTMEIQAEKILSIGTVGLVPHLLIAKDFVGNIPTRFPIGQAWDGALNHYCDRLYIKQ